MNATPRSTVDVRRQLVVSTPDLAAHERAHGPVPAARDLVSLLRDEPRLTLKLLDGIVRRIREVQRQNLGR